VSRGQVSPSSNDGSAAWFDGTGNADVTFDFRGLREWGIDPPFRGQGEHATSGLMLPSQTDFGPSIALDGAPASPPAAQAGDAKVTFLGVVKDQFGRIPSDHRAFYSVRGLAWLAGGLGAGAAMANTGFDEHLIRDSVLDSIVFAPSDEFCEALHEPKFLGDGWFTIPVFAIAAYSEPLIAELPLGEPTAHWGQRCLRTILVGGPPLLALQWLTGGSRPGETSANSHWKPLQDDNGVSGHAFMGAVPYLSAAKITDNPWLEAGF